MLPYYLDRYPHLSAAVRPVANLMEELPSTSELKQMPAGQPELEMRLGRLLPNGHFEAGVSKEFMQQVLRLFQQFEDWHETTPWMEIVDYFYEVQPNPVSIRTSVTVNAHQEWKTSHVRKHVQNTVDLKTTGAAVPAYDIRTRLIFEETIPSENLPQHIQPSLVRIKQRRRFLYGRRRMGIPIWAYDLTRSWSGKTRAEAEQRQKQDDTVYEIELECLAPEAYMAGNAQDSVFLATSMLIKMTQVFETLDFSLEPAQKAPTQY